MKTLSEKEIQQKLYGHLRNGSRTIHEDVSALSLAPKSSSAVALKPMPPAPKSASAGSSSANSAELFRLESLEEATPVTLPELPVAEKPAAVVSPVETARPMKAPARPLPESKPSVYRPAPRPAAQSSGSGIADTFFQKALPLIIAGFKTVGFKLIEALGFVFAAVFSLISILDLRKPHVRKAGSIFGIIALLYVVFASINTLNTNREEAMRSPAKTAGLKPKESDAKNKKTLLQRPEKSAVAVKAPGSQPAKPLKVTPPSAAALTIPPASEGNYVIQVATFALRSDAIVLVENFTKASTKSFVKPLTRPGGKTYFCVFIGRFRTYDEAETRLADFRKKEISRPFQDAFVRSL